MDQPTKGEHRNRGSLTTASLTLVPLDLKNSVKPMSASDNPVIHITDVGCGGGSTAKVPMSTLMPLNERCRGVFLMPHSSSLPGETHVIASSRRES